jgi:hypothetical protein|tara:strand:- start:4032 stop:4409 length:378 start_codon:yes stop_codon:yes gene_type:complete
MRLYKSSNGQWFGTQRDAQRGAPRDWTEVDVPTSKQDLINWLCANKVGGGYNKPEDSVAGQYEPEATSELLTSDTYSWARWALDKLVSGQKSEAEEMLKLILKEQKLRLQLSGAMTSDGFLVREK